MRERGTEESEVTGGKRGKSFTTTTFFFFFFPSSAGERSYRTGRYILAVSTGSHSTGFGESQGAGARGIASLVLASFAPKETSRLLDQDQFVGVSDSSSQYTTFAWCSRSVKGKRNRCSVCV